MDDLEKLNRNLADAEAATEHARARLQSVQASEAAAKVFYLSTPMTDEAAVEDADRRLVAAKAEREKVERLVGKAETFEKARRLERDREQITVESTELQALVTVLHRHPYGPELAAQAEIDRMHEERVVKPMLAKNAERRAQWDRAAELARKLGDIGFPSRVPRPQPNEAVVLARVATAKARIAEGRRESTAHEFIEPFFKPTWNDALAETHANAMRLLEQGATNE